MKKDPLLPVRAQAALTISAVLLQQASLASLMTLAQQRVAREEQPLLQELCFGTLRWQPQLQSILNRLLDKPLKPKDSDIHSLLLLGLYQLKYLRIPDHAAINNSVAACKSLKKTWAEKLVNGVLRQYQRTAKEIDAALLRSPSYTTAHPNWLRKNIEQYWPDRSEAVFSANNSYPPFTLRINLAKISRSDYLQLLQDKGWSAQATPFSDFGVTLEQAVEVNHLPLFSSGAVSVQDEAAQLAAPLLSIEPGQRILDACCAPGGKTGHILELAAEFKHHPIVLTALDLEPRRMEKVRENLDRLGYQQTNQQQLTSINLICADAVNTDQWWDQQLFDRILLDAPCSATGVIRRHPDIKVLRNATDIAKLAQLQLKLMKSLWLTLRPGGKMIYATCSVLPTENTEVVGKFLATQADAQHINLQADWGIPQAFGRQLLPQTNGHDGFYYACLKKTA